MNWDLGVCAIVSDIHGNRHALEAVLDDLTKERIDRVICLGDTIGYGASPLRCLELVNERAELAMLGNHDHAALHAPVDFNSVATASTFWTRRIIEQCKRSEEVFEYLRARPEKLVRADVLMVHGSPRDPLNEYVFPRDVYDPDKLNCCFEELGEQRISFQGHTHMPGIFTEGPDPTFSEGLSLVDKIFKLDPAARYMINVGSVGQPRDGDPRASYLLFDGETCRFRRVEYSVDDAIGEILKLMTDKEFVTLPEDRFHRFAARLASGS